NYNFMAGDAGVHTFSVTLKTASGQSVTATDTVTNTISGSQAGITVNPASASTLVVSGFSSPTTAGNTGSVTVTAVDAYGNTATSYTGTVIFSSGDNQAILPANYAFTSTDSGSHTFNNGATLRSQGAQTITATDTGNSLITGSASIQVTPAAATHF